MQGGVLTGKYRNGEQGRGTKLKGSVSLEENKTTDSILDELFSVAKITQTDPGVVALAWLKSKGVIPVLGPRTSDQLENNLSAIDLKLTLEQTAKLDELSGISQGYPYELNHSHDSRLVITGGTVDKIAIPQSTVR